MGSRSVLVCVKVVKNENKLLHLDIDTYRFAAVWSVVGRIGRDVVAVEALRRLETHVIVAGLVVLAETKLGRGQKRVCHRCLVALAKRSGQHFLSIPLIIFI